MSVEARLGTSTEIAPGLFARAKARFLELTHPHATALHEGAHALMALLTGVGFSLASRIGGIAPDGTRFSGVTYTKGYNAEVFMAAAAMGCDGAGHDEMVVEINGDSPMAAQWAAHSTLTTHKDEWYSISSLIEEQGTINEADGEWARQRILNPQEADVELFDSQGQKEELIAEVNDGIALIPVEIKEVSPEDTSERESDTQPQQEDRGKLIHAEHRFGKGKIIFFNPKPQEQKEKLSA